MFSDINECYPPESNPCQNGADCVNLEGSFQCDCVDGYEGELCENSKDTATCDLCLVILCCVTTLERLLTKKKRKEKENKISYQPFPCYICHIDVY